MGLLDLITKTAFGFKGNKPPLAAGNERSSTLHQNYSITGDPKQKTKVPTPSALDLNGQVPTISTSSEQKLPYLSHLPK